jgi:hypothetical protein
MTPTQRMLLWLPCVLTCIFALSAETPLTNDDIVKLHQSGFSAEVIEQKIAVSATAFRTDTDALIALKSAGVPDQVIASMLRAGSAQTTSKTAQVVSTGATGAVYVYRTHNVYFGIFLKPTVFCDGRGLARIANGKFIAFEVPSGRHVFAAADPRQGSVAVDVQPGSRTFLKMEIKQGVVKGSGRLLVVETAVARGEMRELAALDPGDILDTTFRSFSTLLDLAPN